MSALLREYIEQPCTRGYRHHEATYHFTSKLSGNDSVFEYIKIFYNRYQLPSIILQMPPILFEAMAWLSQPSSCVRSRESESVTGKSNFNLGVAQT